MQINDVKQVIEAVNDRCDVTTVNYGTVQEALDIKEQYGYSYYDSLILASALESGCHRIFTEDMPAGQIINNKLEIVNPFESRLQQPGIYC